MIFKDDPVDAWKEVVSRLLEKGGEDFNILVSFLSGSADEGRMLEFDPRRLGDEYDSIRDVANTIFPRKSLENSASRAEFYKRYLRAHDRSSRKRWGTYFERLIRFGDGGINQMERVISALMGWKKSYRAALYMHTSSAETDSLRPIGNPCLQYVQLCCPSVDKIDMVAVYRNHDYFNKALGNFYGLARLLNFIGTESKREPGRVTCLSIHAYYDVSDQAQRALAQLNQ